MIYGIVCFATLFSFVGTVLGGIWADQSWGRFLGLGSQGKWHTHYRPLERADFASALGRHHSRTWPGQLRHFRQRGHRVVSWFFGVNMLGIGLHSYGFTEAAFKWLVLFVGRHRFGDESTTGGSAS